MAIFTQKNAAGRVSHICARDDGRTRSVDSMAIRARTSPRMPTHPLAHTHTHTCAHAHTHTCAHTHAFKQPGAHTAHDKYANAQTATTTHTTNQPNNHTHARTNRQTHKQATTLRRNQLNKQPNQQTHKRLILATRLKHLFDHGTGAKSLPSSHKEM